MIDSRPCRSAPSCFARGIAGGKTIRGVKIRVAVDTYGLPPAIDVSPVNVPDPNLLPVRRELADGGFQGPALGDLGYRGKRSAKADRDLGISVKASARGRDGQIVLAGIYWVVERSFGWLSRSTLSRRLHRLVVEETNR